MRIGAEVIHPEDRAGVVAGFLVQLRRRGDYASAFRAMRQDGTVCHLRAYGRFLAQSGRRGTYLGVVIDATKDTLREQELQAAHARQQHDALHDALTGLPNRRSFDQWRAGLADVPPVPDPGHAVLAIDLDWFKQINDVLGHAAGDAALCRAARILRAMSPPRARLYRMGGDEFLMVIPAPGPAPDLMQMATGMIEELTRPFVHDDQPCQNSASIGICLGGSDGPALDASCLRADRALYRSKTAGRGLANLAEDSC